MDINKRSRNQVRLQGAGLVVLVLVIAGLLMQISRQYTVEFDWTASGRHTLNPISQKVAQKITSPLKITAYANDDISNVRQEIRNLVKRYQQLNDRISLEFVDPLLNPQLVQDLGIQTNGEMIIEYQGRNQSLKELTEQGMTNAIHRLLRNNDRQVLFVGGHGERDPLGQANHDLGIFGKSLSNQGLNIGKLDIGTTLAVPENTALLVIASPQVDYLQGEARIIRDYVSAGGNLLWFIEPGKTTFLKPLADYLKLDITDGTIVDYDLALLGNEPTMVLGQYQSHPITDKLQSIQTVYPRVVAINVAASEGWQTVPLLQSMPRSWLETGEMKGTISYDPSTDKPGPLSFAQVLTRSLSATDSPAAENKDPEQTPESPKSAKEQRVVVIGDGDFLSNTYLGTQGNMSMGNSMINWLVHDDNFIDIPAVVAPDNKITASFNQLIMFAAVILVILPIILIASGLIIWLKRRKK